MYQKIGQESSLRPGFRLMWLINGSAAFTSAALAATLLEGAGLWTRLVPDPDPFMDRGAPVWVWWILLLISFLPWFAPGYRRPPTFGRKTLIRIAIVTLAGLIVFSAAALLHATHDDPVQGRYYGIPGFTVGRQFSNEYGTYYGVTGGAAGVLLGLLSLLVFFYGVKRSESL